MKVTIMLLANVFTFESIENTLWFLDSGVRAAGVRQTHVPLYHRQLYTCILGTISLSPV